MSHANQILELLSDGQPHDRDMITKEVYGIDGPSSAHTSQRISDLRKRGHVIQCHIYPHNRKKCWYQLIKPVEVERYSPAYKKLTRPILPVGRQEETNNLSLLQN